jgi:hypothetical protein
VANEIDAADRGYHAHVLKQIEDAHAVQRSWAIYLSQKYQLGPRDQVDPDGRILRGQDLKTIQPAEKKTA